MVFDEPTPPGGQKFFSLCCGELCVHRLNTAGGTQEIILCGAGLSGQSIMHREKFDHGFAEEDWGMAKEEAREALIAEAARKGLIAYSDLVSKIKALSLGPHGWRLAHMLEEISSSEHLAGRGMLTVVVVHNHGDPMPGTGFFNLAQRLGHDTTDREAFWVQELEKVYSTWG